MLNRARQQSGALSWQDVYDWGNDVLNGIQEVTPVITQAADIYNKVNDKGKRQTTWEYMLENVMGGLFLVGWINECRVVETEAVVRSKRMSSKLGCRRRHEIQSDERAAEVAYQPAPRLWRGVYDG